MTPEMAEYIISGKTKDKTVLLNLAANYYKKKIEKMKFEFWKSEYPHDFKVRTIDYLKTKCSRMPRGFNSEFDELIIKIKSRFNGFHSKKAESLQSNYKPSRYETLLGKRAWLSMPYSIQKEFPDLHICLGKSGYWYNPKMMLGVHKDVFDYSQVIGFETFFSRPGSINDEWWHATAVCPAMDRAYNTTKPVLYGIHYTRFVLDINGMLKAPAYGFHVYKRMGDGSFVRHGRGKHDED